LERSLLSKLKTMFATPAKCIDIEQRGKVLESVLNIAIPIILAYSLFNYLYGYETLAFFQLGSLLLIIPAWLMSRRATLVATGEFLALFSTAMILLYLLYDGGIAGLGFIWGWLFPFIAFYVAGIQRGWYWCIGFFMAAEVIFMQSLGITATYNADIQILFFTAYLFYLIVSYVFNNIRFQYLFDLEQQVQQRTAQLEHASLYDPLTDMPNRTHVTTLIQALIDRHDENFAVLNLDIDRFNEVNNVLGYEHGDQLLIAFAERIQSYTGDRMFAGRLGADEFAIILQDLPGKKTKQEVNTVVIEHVKQLQETMEQPYLINSAEIELEITIGIEFPTAYNTNASHMIRRANFACHIAKKELGKVAIYDSEQDAHSARKFHVFGELRRAIQNHELRLFYQPKIDMALARVTDAEALIRWISPAEGMISPNDFIPVAESTGLIHPVTQFVLEEAMRQQALWHKKITTSILPSTSLCAISWNRI